MRPLLLAVLCGLSLSACTLGNIHNNQSIAGVNSQAQANAQIKRGMTKAQVRDKWGDPFENSVFNSTTVWTYQVSSSNYDGTAIIAGALGGGVPRRDLKRISVTFNGAGRVSKVDYVELQN